jgi:hypothetical protein
MRRGIQVDLLTGKNIELRDGVSEAFEMRQMRMEIECSYAMEQAEPIECSVDCTLVAPPSLWFLGAATLVYPGPAPATRGINAPE